VPPLGSVRVRVLEAIEELHALRPQWIDLARRALEPNPFYEESFLLPLLEHRGWIPGLRVATVERGDRLVGLLPLIRRRPRTTDPIARQRAAFAPDQPYGFLGTPLLDGPEARSALHALLDALDDGALGGGLLELVGYGADGQFSCLLTEALAVRRQPYLELDGWRRGLFRPRACFEAYLRSCMEERRIRELRRQRRRLQGSGALGFERAVCDASVPRLCEQFLLVERAGWKGRLGTAIGSRPEDAEFFRAMCVGRAREGTLLFEALALDGQPIALSVALLASGDPSAGFVFKITHDEKARAFGPGVLLEFTQFEAYDAERGPVRWMDSCTGQGREHLDRLWADRRLLGHCLIAPRGLRGAAIVSALRAARELRRMARRAAGPVSPSLARSGGRA